MRVHHQPSEFQESIQSKDGGIAIVAVGFNADVLPIVFEVEWREPWKAGLYSIVRTKRAPRQWFLQCEVFGDASPAQRGANSIEDCRSYGESVSGAPLRSLWLAPHLSAEPSLPALSAIELLSELPRAYALDGHLQRFIARAYDGYFFWCEQGP